MSSMLSSNLAIDCGSPGSSIFDLPTSTTLQLNSRSGDLKSTELELDLDDINDTPACLVISGGTGCNAICSAFGVANAIYVLPVSDDGGSSSEIIRVIGGPSIGDIRSRLIRLIPPCPSSSPLERIRNLLAYRLPSKCSDREARDEWRDIVEGRSKLWEGIPGDRKEMIRGFLVHFESEVLKRAHKNFSFINGSIGNYFLSAAQEFFRSLPSAIFLFSSITNSQATILPVIVTNHTVTIAAELADGTRLVGQCEISHPVRSSQPQISISGDLNDEEDSFDGARDDFGIDDEDAMSPVNETRKRNVLFEASAKENGEAYESLSARISRLFYINTYGTEIQPSPNPEFIQHLGKKEVLVYSCGSLWTSIIPCLALRGVADGIARSRSLKAKILLLNSQNDRETDGYTATDYVNTIVRTLNTTHTRPYPGLSHRGASTTYPTSAFVTHLVYLKGGQVDVNVKQLTAMGVKCVEVEAQGGDGVPKFDARSVRRAIVDILDGSEP